MLYGHRRNIEGYARCLMEFDTQLPVILEHLRPDDLLIITADHGNDPSAPGTDHTREYVPILNYGKNIAPKNIGVRRTFADIGTTIVDALGVDSDTKGASYLSEILSD